MDDYNEAVETVDDVEADGIDAAFDEGWDDTQESDDDFDLSDDEAEAEPVAQPDEAEAAEETDGEPGSSPDSPNEQDAEPADSEEAKEEHQLFSIKVNGEERKVNLAEITELAQKGADYDRVKQERDSFKQDAPTIQKYKAYEAFLQELADGSDTDIDSLMDSTRARLLVAKAERDGKELSEEEAMLTAKAMRHPKEDAQPEQKEARPEPEDPEEAKRRMMLQFLVAYPDVEPESIPKRVWDESNVTGDLVGAYQRHENRMLMAQIETLKNNTKNRERSTGSRRTAGATAPKDPFDEVWDSD